MTAPADHWPYAAPTDLRTAEDVAEWLDTLHRGPPAERIFGVQDAIVALDARLDRERRQACRRGALACWRRWSSFVRKWRDVGAGGQLDAAALSTAPADKHAQWALGVSILDLELALAFRAAARQP